MTRYRVSWIYISLFLKVLRTHPHICVHARVHTYTHTPRDRHTECLCWLRLNESSCCCLILIDNSLCQADASDTPRWVSKGLNNCSPFSMWHRECRRWRCAAIQVTWILLCCSLLGLISCHLTYQGAIVALWVTRCFLGNGHRSRVQTRGEEIILGY